LYNEELHNFYSSPNISMVAKSMKVGWVGHVAGMGDARNAYKILIGNPERKRPLRRPRIRGKSSIKIYLKLCMTGFISG